MKERSSSATSLGKRDSVQSLFPMAALIKLEDALYKGNINKCNREYCGRLRSIANMILDKIN